MIDLHICVYFSSCTVQCGVIKQEFGYSLTRSNTLMKLFVIKQIVNKLRTNDMILNYKTLV